MWLDPLNLELKAIVRSTVCMVGTQLRISAQQWVCMVCMLGTKLLTTESFLQPPAFWLLWPKKWL